MSGQYWVPLICIIAILIIFARYQNRERMRWIGVGISLLLTGRYLYWRALYTLNDSDGLSLTISLVIYFAEIYGFLATFLFYFQVATPTSPSSVISDESKLPMVDLFVTTLNEPAEIVRRSLVGCLAVDYPEGRKRVFLLDDGCREEMRQLAGEMGCVYLGRLSREYAKAGNLNNALKHSTAEFIANFDVDHVPTRDFLKKTMGFFSDAKVAIVQTPHYFYNPDIYQKNLRLRGKLRHEQDLFFQVIQPGRDYNNSSFYCGSGAVFRREALNRLDGFITKSVTEDIHTTMRLHALGYRTVYVREILAVGLSPESFKSYLRQRERWTKGHIQIFLSRDNPLILKGLTLAQRINYFASIYYFLFGPSRIIFLSVPLFFLLLGIPPFIASLTEIINYYGAHYIGALVAFAMISGVYRNPFWSDVYEAVMCFSLSKVTLQTILNPGQFLFHVTPKGEKQAETKMDYLSIFPHALLAGLLVFGVVLGIYRLFEASMNQDALIISLILGLYNIIILICAIFAGREQIQNRSSFRLEKQVSCEIISNFQKVVTTTADISETGMGITMDKPIFLDERVKVCLNGNGEYVEVDGTVVRNDYLRPDKVLAGIRFSEMEPRIRQILIRILYAGPDWAKIESKTIGFGESFRSILISPVRTFEGFKPVRRMAPRIKALLRCEIRIGGRIISSRLEDISSRGLRIVIPEEIEMIPDQLSVRVHLQDKIVASGHARLVWSRPGMKKRVAGIRWVEGHTHLYEAIRSIPQPDQTSWPFSVEEGRKTRGRIGSTPS